MKLAVANINAVAPYEVTMTPQGALRFVTDLSQNYRISFVDDRALGGCTTFQFVIERMEQQRTPHDPKVELTIMAILNEFFASHQNVLIYFCDTSDGREAKRNRLFLAWFDRNAAPGRFTIRTAHAIVEGEGFYAAVIVENRNPKLADVIADFEQTAAVLTEGKPQ